jgi:hypothetical protein
MEPQRHSSTRLSCRRDIGRSTSFLAASIGIAAFLFTGQSICQTRIAGRSAGQAQAMTAFEQAMAQLSAEVETEISAPTPQVEEANLAKPPASLSLWMKGRGQASSQSSSLSGIQSSSQDSATAATSTKAAATKTKPPHRELGIALAAVGTTALVVGVVAFAASRFDICANEHSGGCQQARDAGLILMPVGGAVAITGFYFQFHR